MTEQEEIGKKRNPMQILRIISLSVFMIMPLSCGIAAGLAAIGSEQDSRYFADSPMSQALIILTASAVLASFLSLFLFKGGKTADKDTGTVKIVKALSSLLVGAAATALSLYVLLKGLGVEWDLLFALFALLSAAFFIIKPFNERKTEKLFFSLGTFALGIAIIALLYFDFKIELNSHYKLSVQFGAVGLILSAIADAREVMSRISLSACILLRSISLIPMLICIGAVPSAIISGSVALPGSYIAFSLFYLAHVILNEVELCTILINTVKDR